MERKVYQTIGSTRKLFIRASYINLPMASIENILFKDTGLKNSYFQETKKEDQIKNKQN